MKKALVILTILVTVSALWAAAKPLRVYLPRNIQVESATLRLADVCIVRGDSGEQVARANEVTLGRAPFSREKLALDRRTLMSRLASSGFAPADVEFSGADVVLVERKEQAVLTDKLLSAALEYLEKNRPGPAGCVWRLSGKIPDLSIPNREAVDFQVHLAKNSSNEKVRLVVFVVSGKEELASADLAFDVVFPARQVKAMRDIAAGAIIAEEDFKVETVMLDHRPPQGPTLPTGMEANQKIAAGAEIRSGMFKAPKPVQVIRRDQAVSMRIEGDGFRLTALGTALADGRVGEYIKVRNNDTQKIVTCRVSADGAVYPVFEEMQR